MFNGVEEEEEEGSKEKEKGSSSFSFYSLSPPYSANSPLVLRSRRVHPMPLGLVQTPYHLRVGLRVPVVILGRDPDWRNGCATGRKGGQVDRGETEGGGEEEDNGGGAGEAGSASSWASGSMEATQTTLTIGNEILKASHLAV